MTGPPRSYYAVLGVKPDASPAAIRDAYRSKARVVHPDSTSGTGSPEAMRELNEAWRILGDPTRRKRYDEQRGNGRGRNSSTVRIRHEKRHWSPLDHGIDGDETDDDDLGYGEAGSGRLDYDDLDPGVPLDKTSARILRFLTVGAVANAAIAVFLFGLALLLQAGELASMGVVVLGISVASFTMAPLYAMSRSRRKIDV